MPQPKRLDQVVTILRERVLGERREFAPLHRKQSAAYDAQRQVVSMRSIDDVLVGDRIAVDGGLLVIDAIKRGQYATGPGVDPDPDAPVWMDLRVNEVK